MGRADRRRDLAHGALGGIEWGISADTKALYAGSSDIVSIFDELMRPLGRNTLAVAPPKSRPGLAAIDPATGKVIWHTPTPKDECTYKHTSRRLPADTCAAGNSGAPASMPGIVFAGSTDGWFRAYDSANGKVIWKFNSTGQTYATTNGVPAQPGGGIDGAGPTIAATLVSFVVGLAVIHWLLKFVSTRSFAPFVVYRVVLGVSVLTLVAAGAITAGTTVS